MIQNLLLDFAAGHRAATGPASGALGNLLRAVLVQVPPQQPCRTASALAGASLPAEDAAGTALLPSCSICAHVDGGGLAGCSGSMEAWAGLGGVRHHLTGLLRRRQTFHHEQLQPQIQQQQRGISTTSSASYKFDSHLTRYNKSKVANRDNFQRFRDSGRDARVAADILQEGERQDRRRGRGGARNEANDALLELRSIVYDCRDLRAMQMLVRECANDLDGSMVCNVLGRLPALRQDTPSSAAPDVLARRVADKLMTRLEAILANTSTSSLAHALTGLANAGVLPSLSLLEAVHRRLTAPGVRGDNALLETDPKMVSKLLFATAKFIDLHRHQTGAGTGGGVTAGRSRIVSSSGSSTSSGEGEGEVEADDAGEALRGRLWPALRAAAEAKLLRALGEEPPGAAAVVRRRVGPQAPEEDDSMPQVALRFICIALSLARETHPGTWTAAARLVARHAGELQPAVAADVLRSYAISGGSTLDGGSVRLLDAVWGALGPRVDELEMEAQLDLLIATLKLAAAKDSAAATTATDVRVAAAAVPVLSRLVATRVPSLSISEATHLTISLADLHSKTVAEAAAAAASGSSGGGGGAAAPPPAWLTHSYGALPKLLADLLLLRGMEGFGATRFASVALGLGLLGHKDVAFWSKVAAAAAPEVPRMDATALSRLLGGFNNAALAAEATAAAAPGGASAAVPAPGPALLAAAHARARELLDAGEGAVSGKPLFHLVRCLAEWSEPVDGGSAGAVSALTGLADRLVSDKAAAAEAAAAPPAVRQRIVAALRRAGLGDHGVVGRLGGGK